MKTLRYFIWNSLIMGTLALGYFIDAQKTSGTIIGWYYVFIVAYMTVAVFASKDKKIQEIFNKSKMEWWKWIFEFLFLVSTIKMGYLKIAICMFYEQISVAYILVSIKCQDKENEA